MDMQKEVIKLAQAFPTISEERIQLLQKIKKLYSQKERIALFKHENLTDAQLRKLIEKREKSA